MSVLDSILKQHEKAAKKSNNKNMSDEERLKQYFTTYLKKSQKEGQKRVRILPTSDGSSPFKEVYFHNIQVDGNWVKLYDPGKNDNEKSPLNDVHDRLMSTGNEEDRKIAYPYKSRKFYIVKVIDRDAEEDGVKFWRFKDNYKNEGAFDKIVSLMKLRGDVTDPEEGRDLLIQLGKTTSNNGVEYTQIQAIIPEDKSKLHEDETIAKEWLEDGKTWEDVYSKKPLEYLEIVAQGDTPMWDKEKEKFVSSHDDVNSETTIGGSKKEEDPQTNEEEDDDLPF